MKKKYGWTAAGIIGAIFTPMGLFFLILGILLRKAGAGRGPDDPIIILYVFGGIGALFLIVGLGLSGAGLNRRRLLRRAYEGGQSVSARITGVQAQTNVNINGRHPVTVECAYTDSSGVVHVYRSRYLYLASVEKLLTSDTVPVYIDRMNDSVGFVDVDAVLPEIRIHR